MPVSHKLNQAAINQLLTSAQGPVAKGLLIRGVKVQTQARKNLGGATGSGPKRVDTGLLRASIAVELRRTSRGLVVRIGTNVKYARLVHNGTGIYGPRGAPIVPKTARYLKFKPKGATEFVYAKSVKGMKPNPFLTAALPAAILNKGKQSPG